MGSRVKENPDRTFYWFFQASCPIARDKDPGVLFQFPEDFSDQECLQSVPRFCFPYDIERVKDSVAVQHFTFALTDLEGCQRFGFCRITSSSQTCLCILSYLPWFEVFYKLLNNLADYGTRGQNGEMRELLTALYRHPVPLANSSPSLQLIPYFVAPDPKVLPSIPESRNLTELIVAVDVGNLLQLYASMMFERRIIICCSKLSTLTACVHACNSMLFPMYWQHIFIPVLPPHLLDYCCAPMPYLIGVHSSLIERVRSRALEDVVILNVDTNTMESPHDDFKKLPADVMTALKVRLKRQAASPGCGVAQAFLRAQALLFGSYRDALVYPNEEPVAFSEEMFLTHKSPCMRQFFQTAIHLQFFKQFIDGRLEMLNHGKEPDDLFEEEMLQCGASSGGSKSYQQWVGNLKKGGGSLILTVKSKAQMYKNVKCHSMFGRKNLKGKEPHLLQRGGSVCSTHSYRFNKSDCLQDRLPITQHFGKSRPRRPTRKSSLQQGEEAPQQNSGGSGEESREDLVSDELTEEEEFSMMADLEEMDLLGEIFDTLNTQSSSEPGLLYSTRSLDLFSSDCTDFISRTSLTTPSEESLSLSFGNNGSLRSWEEGLEEGPGAAGEESTCPGDESGKEDGDGPTEVDRIPEQAEPSVDLGRLVENFVELGVELEEELSENQAATSGETPEETSETSKDIPEETHEKSGGSPEKEEKEGRAEEPNEKDTWIQDEQVIAGEAQSPDVPRDTGAEDEKEEEEEVKTPSTSKALPTVALFQSKSEIMKSVHNPKGFGMSLKVSPRSPGSNVAPKSDDVIIEKSDLATEDEDFPPPKVSELKKRFEL